MCGFAGIVDLDKLEINNYIDNCMKAALKSLNPRGPDQNGFYTDDNVYMVHARLSIIDISDNFQFCKNITNNKQIKVNESLNTANIALLNKFVICVTS